MWDGKEEGVKYNWEDLPQRQHLSKAQEEERETEGQKAHAPQWVGRVDRPPAVTGSQAEHPSSDAGGQVEAMGTRGSSLPMIPMSTGS